MLDIFQRDIAETAAVRPEEAPRLPATFGETFDAAWSNAFLFQQSVAGHNARLAALDDYLGEIERKTGKALGPDIAKLDPDMDHPWFAANEVITGLRQNDSSFPFAPLNDDEIEARAVERSRRARADYAALAGRERTFGGSLGLVAGGLAGTATDPVNIVALPVAPAEGIGILASGLRWAAIGGAAQAAIEVAGLPFREEVQPGYMQGTEPLVNVLEAAGGAALIGGGAKALGNVWTRVKTGAWPQTIRDAGNIVESEANVHAVNRLHGVDGEVSHRAALSKAIDDLVNGRQVDVSGVMSPEAWQDARRLMVRLEGERAATLPQFDERIIALMSEEAGLRDRDSLLQSQLESVGEGNPAAAETLARLQAVEAQIAEATGDARRALMRRRDELLTDTTPEALRGEAAPLELRRNIEAERASIADRLASVTAEREGLQKGSVYTSPAMIGERPARFESMLDMRDAAVRALEAAKAERKAAGEVGELPFEATASEAHADEITAAMADGVGQIAKRAGYDMPRAEAEGLSKRLLSATGEEAGMILDELIVRPRTLSETLPSASAAAAERRAAAKVQPETLPPELASQVTPEAVEKLRAEPDLDETVLRDLDRLRAERGDVDIPVGESVGPAGERTVQTRKIESVLAEADERLAAAKEIEACAGPQPEAAE